MSIDALDIDLGSVDGRRLMRAVAERHGEPIARMAGRLDHMFLLRSAWCPGLRFVGAQTRLTRHFSFGGAGLALEDAVASCLGEAADRLSQLERQGDIACVAPLAEVRDRLDPAIVSLADEVLARSGRVDGPIDWLAGAETLVPADWCLRREQPGPLAIPGAALSVGCAAGRTDKDAYVRALLELIERDAVSLWWQGGRQGRALPLDRPETSDAAQLLAQLRSASDLRKTSVIDVTTDIAIPVAVAYSTDQAGGGFSAGFAARTSFGAAASAAITEMCQMEIGLQLAMLKREQLGDTALSDGDRAHVRRAAVAPATDPRFEVTEPRRAEPSRGADDLSKVRAGLTRSAVAAQMVGLTRADIGIPVAKAIAPQLQLMPADLRTSRLETTAARNSGRIPGNFVSLV